MHRPMHPPASRSSISVQQVFQGIAATMLADFDQIQAQIVHPGARGEDRELAVKDFLSKYLPKKYAVGSGQIIDRSGGISSQCDIVVYDAFNCPLLLVKEGYQVFPVETVLAVIEVKSVLTAGKIKESVETIASAKALKREDPIAGYVFAFRSNYKQEDRIEAVAHTLLRVSKDLPARHRVDVICVLAEGLVRELKSSPDWGDEGYATEVFFPEVSPLAFFLYWLIEAIGERKSSMPDVLAYASDASHGYLGIVKVLAAG